MAKTDTKVNSLVINKLTRAQYEAIEEPSETELYLVPDEIDDTPTQGSDNPVKSGGVRAELDGKQATLTHYSETAQGVAKVSTSSAMVQVDPYDGGTVTVKSGLFVVKNNSDTIILSSGIRAAGKVCYYDNEIATKADIPDISGKQDVIDSTHKLSADLVEDGTTNKSYTATEKSKLEGIAAGAEVNVQANWNETNTSSDAFIQNKPTDLAHIGDTQGSATIANFDPLTDTVHIAAQTLSSSAQAQVRTNIGAGTSNFSGSYNDLTDKPTIPDELADLSDDSTHRVVSDTEKAAWNGKQAALVSGTNIKTINDESILGSGNISVATELPSNTAYLSNDSGDGIVPDDGIKAVTVTSAAAMTISPDVVTVIDGDVGTAIITLQVPQDSLAHVWDILMTTDSSVAITFAMSNSETILYPSGFSVGASKAVEVSVIGIGETYYLRYGEFA